MGGFRDGVFCGIESQASAIKEKLFPVHHEAAYPDHDDVDGPSSECYTITPIRIQPTVAHCCPHLYAFMTLLSAIMGVPAINEVMTVELNLRS